MGNPRQRRKARSSSHRPVSHSKRAKTKLKKTPSIRGPKLLQDNWDPKITVKQNYAALGLSFGLNPYSSGGIEKREGSMHDPSEITAGATASQQFLDDPKQNEQPIPKGHGRIIRDKDGNVLGFEIPETETQEDAPMDMEALEPQVEPNTLNQWVTHLGSNTQVIDSGNKKSATNIVQELERLSTKASTNTTTLSYSYSGVGGRFTSEGEKQALMKLVERYGKDIEKMAMDRKLNPEQRTVGQLRKALMRAGMNS